MPLLTTPVRVPVLVLFHWCRARGRHRLSSLLQRTQVARHIGFLLNWRWGCDAALRERSRLPRRHLCAASVARAPGCQRQAPLPAVRRVGRLGLVQSDVGASSPHALVWLGARLRLGVRWCNTRRLGRLPLLRARTDDLGWRGELRSQDMWQGYRGEGRTSHGPEWERTDLRWFPGGIEGRRKGHSGSGRMRLRLVARAGSIVKIGSWMRCVMLGEILAEMAIRRCLNGGRGAVEAELGEALRCGDLRRRTERYGRRRLDWILTCQLRGPSTSINTSYLRRLGRPNGCGTGQVGSRLARADYTPGEAARPCPRAAGYARDVSPAWAPVQRAAQWKASSESSLHWMRNRWHRAAQETVVAS